MNMSVQIAVQHPTFSSLEYIPRRVIARSYGNLISDILRNYHPVFHNSCTILHSYQPCPRIPISSQSSQHELFFYCFDNSHPNGCEVVSSFYIVVFYSKLLPLITVSLIKQVLRKEVLTIQLLICPAFRLLNLKPPDNKITTDNSLIKTNKRFKE